MGTSLSTFFFSSPRLSSMNVLTWLSATPSSFSAPARSSLLSAKKPTISSRRSWAVRTPLSFFLSMDVKDWSWLSVVNRSSLLPSSVLAALPNCSTVSPIAAPLPSRLAAPVASSLFSAPSEFTPSGPSVLLSSVIWS